MKMIHVLVLMAALMVPALSAGAQETTTLLVADVLKLASAGVGDEVLLAYVQAAKGPATVSADDIIALKNAKVGTAVVQALLARNPAPIPAAAPTNPAPNPDPRAVPEPLFEPVPGAPGPGYRWYPGHWYWNGGWFWYPGTWSTDIIIMPGFYRWHRW